MTSLKGKTPSADGIPAGLVLSTTKESRAVGKKMLAKVQKLGPCPPELKPAARAEWDLVIGELIKRDMITSLDKAVVAAYCTAYVN